MKSVILLMGILLFPLATQSQNPGRFSKLYDHANFLQSYTMAKELSGQRYFVAGRNIGYWLSDAFIWVHFLDEQGDTLRDVRIFTGDSSAYYTGWQAVAEGDASAIYLAGTQEEFVGQIQYSDGYLMKLNEEGNRVWQKNYGGSNYEAIDALTMTHNNELVFAGVSHSFGDSVWGDIYVVKTDTAGEVIWQKTLGINNFPERCYNIDTAAASDFVLAGVQGFEGGGKDIFVMKISSEGELVWQKTFGNDQNDDNTFPRVRSLKNGDILLTTALRPNSDNLKHAYIARLSAAGETLWEKFYPGTESHSWFGFTTELPDGNLVIAGSVMEFDTVFNTNYRVRGTLTRTDADGNLIWQRKYYTTPNRDNYLFCMTPTSDAGVLMGGTAYRTDNNRQDAWAVKVDSLGCLEPGCDGSVAAPEPGAAIGLNIRPNPTADWLTVSSPEAILLGLRLTDLSGRVLEDVQFFRQHGLREYRFSLAALSPGAYVLSVRTEKGWVSEQVIKK